MTLISNLKNPEQGVIVGSFLNIGSRGMVSEYGIVNILESIFLKGELPVSRTFFNTRAFILSKLRDILTKTIFLGKLKDININFKQFFRIIFLSLILANTFILRRLIVHGKESTLKYRFVFTIEALICSILKKLNLGLVLPNGTSFPLFIIILLILVVPTDEKYQKRDTRFEILVVLYFFIYSDRVLLYEQLLTLKKFGSNNSNLVEKISNYRKTNDKFSKLWLVRGSILKGAVGQVRSISEECRDHINRSNKYLLSQIVKSTFFCFYSLVKGVLKNLNFFSKPIDTNLKNSKLKNLIKGNYGISFWLCFSMVCVYSSLASTQNILLIMLMTNIFRNYELDELHGKLSQVAKISCDENKIFSIQFLKKISKPILLFLLLYFTKPKKEEKDLLVSLFEIYSAYNILVLRLIFSDYRINNFVSGISIFESLFYLLLPEYSWIYPLSYFNRQDFKTKNFKLIFNLKEQVVFNIPNEAYNICTKIYNLLSTANIGTEVPIISVSEDNGERNGPGDPVKQNSTMANQIKNKKLPETSCEKKLVSDHIPKLKNQVFEQTLWLILVVLLVVFIENLISKNKYVGKYLEILSIIKRYIGIILVSIN